MKKIFVMMTVACMAFAMPSQAQVKFGLKGGLNLTSLSATDADDAFSNQAGFFVGPTVKFTLPVVGLSVDASALYDQRQAKLKNNNDETFKAQSIQIPINIRYGVGLSSLVNVFAFAGPQFGFNIGNKNKTWKDYQNNAYDWTLKSSNISANIGIGATILSKLQLKVNYNIALGKTGDIEVTDGTNAVWDVVTGKAKANAWQVSAAYFF